MTVRVTSVEGTGTVVDLRRLRQAEARDVLGIWELRRQLEEWLQVHGIDQWPHGSLPQSVVAADVNRGLWYVVPGPAGTVLAALRLHTEDPDFWPESPPQSVFVHGLMVARNHAGADVGRHLLEWAAHRGRELGARWLRLDCAADNERLKTYYAGLEFEPVRVQSVTDTRGFEVLLMRRPIA